MTTATMTTATVATDKERAERLLQRLIGEWTMESDMAAAPGAATSRYAGTESVRALGGTWVVCDSRTTHPPEAASAMLITLGFDATRGRIVGAVAASMMSNLWVYDGSLDADGEGITLDTEGPSFTVDGELGKYRDTIRFESDAVREFTSSYLAEDGTWKRFMSTRLRRAGAA